MSEDRSYGKYLRDQNKINDEFEAILSHLTLEEIVVLKLELAAKLTGGKFYGNYLLKATKYMVDHAIVRYSIAATKTRKAGAQFLGVNLRHYKAIVQSLRLGNNQGRAKK